MFYSKKFLKNAGIIVIIVIITTYIFYQTRGFVRGPILSFTYPSSGMTMKNSAVEIRGIAKNTTYITMNGEQIFVDEEGNFKEEILLLDGYNIVEVKIKDKFGREKSEKLELVYLP